jgi:hypothetical protein
MENKDYLELTNIVGDLKRSVMFYALNSQNPKYKNCIFLKNIVKNYPKFIKIDSNISQFIDINYLKDDKDLPKIKAENLLMQSIRLQHYLGL